MIASLMCRVGLRNFNHVKHLNRIERERNLIEREKAKARPTVHQPEFDPQRVLFEQSKEIAVTRYPQLADADSKMVRLVEAIDKHCEEIDHPLYSSTDKPLILAEMAAMYLKLKASDLSQRN
jgi:hypothetical protein